jgi:hypothetical protein
MNNPDATCEKCWDEQHVETPIRWDLNPPRWCERHMTELGAPPATMPAEVSAGRTPKSDTRQHMTQDQKASKKVLVVLLSCSLLLATLAACGLTTVASSPTVTVSCAPAVSHRPHLLIQYDRQTLDYPDTLGHQADMLVASWLNNLPRADSDGVTFFATLLNDDPLNPASTAATLRLDPIAAEPSCPVPQPTSTACAVNPYACVPPIETAAAGYSAAVKQYQAGKQDIDGQVADAQKIVNHLATALSKEQPAPYLTDQDTSVWGVLALASERFSGQTGSKWLIIAGSLINTAGDEDKVPFRLDGAHILIIFETAPDAGTQQRINAYWQSVFHQAGAADTHFYDTGASQTLSAPWNQTS